MKAILVVTGVLVVLLTAGLILLLETGEESKENETAATEYNVRPYVEVSNPSGFVNTDGSTVALSDYVGNKVILIDFMTYSCINCQRTFPYLNAWYEAYKDDGLIVIGIHTPEFAFEHDIKNVQEALSDFGINFPVVLDNEYGTWRAYGNRFWPRKYLIDIHGNIVYDHIGEGAYDETEEKIVSLLEERRTVLDLRQSISDKNISSSLEEFVHQKKSPETYIGNNRNQYLANKIENQRGLTTFTLPGDFSTTGFYLGGTWAMTGEYAESFANSVLVYPYQAKEVYLVAGSNEPVIVEVWQDGEKVTDSSGEDVRNGVVEIQKNRLYKLINNSFSGEHVLELRVQGSGVQLFAFTFG